MASSGTLLSDLGGGGGGPSGDEDLVKRIFSEMNGGGGGNQMIMSPNPNTTAPMAMDSGPQTSHVIGKDHPTPGDFAAAMHQASRVQQTYQMAPPQGTGAMGPAPGQWGAPYQPQQQQPQSASKNATPATPLIPSASASSSSSASAASSPAPPADAEADEGTEAEDTDDVETNVVVTNWAGTHVTTVAERHRPSTVQALDALVREAHASGRPLRPVS